MAEIVSRIAAIPRGLVDYYMKMLKEHPVLTKAVTSAIVAALGDIISQRRAIAADPTEEFNPRSTFPFFAFGLSCTGPITHAFYNWLDRAVPQGKQGAVVMRMVIERLVFAPLFLGLFFCRHKHPSGAQHAADWRPSLPDILGRTEDELACVVCGPVHQPQLCPPPPARPLCKLHCPRMECLSRFKEVEHARRPLRVPFSVFFCLSVFVFGHFLSSLACVRVLSCLFVRPCPEMHIINADSVSYKDTRLYIFVSRSLSHFVFISRNCVFHT
eukprot:Opistho-2@56305